MLEFQEAVDRILEHMKPAESQSVPVTEALGRILAEDVAADADIPVSDNSAMDGFAVRAADVAAATPDAPVRLSVLETIPAGAVPEHEVREGACSRIMTGAVMPAGADAVVMVEDTQDDGDDHVLIKTDVNPAKTNVRFAGEDVKSGAVVLWRGRRLRAADLGMLAAAGRVDVQVAHRPVVGVLSTGDEIVPPTEPLAPGRVRNSNSYSLLGQCLAAGVIPRVYDIVPDTFEAVTRALEIAATECDFILTSGGVSMGEFDEVRHAVTERGKLIFWQVRMKPGKPLLFGEIGGTPVVGLPGNPVSVMVGFEMFIRPAVMKIMGASEIHKQRHRGVLDHDLRMRMGRRVVILRAVATLHDDGYHLETTGPQGSGILTSMVVANCLAILPSAPEPPKKGDTLEFFFLD